MKIFLCIAIIVGVFLMHIFILQRKQKQIKELRSYMKQINEGEYNLDIADNSEGEISKLKNELYKVAIFLKESSEKSKLEKEKLSESLTDISHQLKTPLTSIRIMLDNIEEDDEMDEQTRQDFLKDISGQIDWINSLVIALLKIAKFGANAITLNKTEINVKELFDSVVKNLAVLIDVKKISINVNINEGAMFVGDYKWEQEAITNILKNAIEHSEDESNIEVKAYDNNLFLKIIIKDSGEGISNEDKKHIFERFYRSKNSNENSVGVGLSLAKTIIEKDNGYINVESETGAGTAFEIKYMH